MMADTDFGVAPLRRLHNELGEVEGARAAAFPGPPTEHCDTGPDTSHHMSLLQSCFLSLRACTRRWCAAWLLLAGTSATKETTNASSIAGSKAALSCVSSVGKRLLCIDVLRDGCMRLGCFLRSVGLHVFRCIRHGCSSSWLSLPQLRDSHAFLCSRCSCKSRRGRCRVILGLLLLFLITELLLVIRVGTKLMRDPYTEMRIHLRVAYPADDVDNIVQALRKRHVPQQSLPPPGDLRPFEPLHTIVQTIDKFVEKPLLLLLTTMYAHTHAEATRAAEVWMTRLSETLPTAVFPMLGAYPAQCSGVLLDNSRFICSTTKDVTAGKRMFAVPRAAVLRCTHGVPTLPAPQRVSDSADKSRVEAAFNSLWTDFTNASTGVGMQPKCLARSQRRMPCADAGITADSRIATAAGVPPDESSRVQYLYEHRRLDMGGDALAELYYSYTPGLPTRARNWYKDLWGGVSGEDTDEMRMRVLAQEERFRRTTATDSGDRSARPLSGVILFLSGAADRNPEGRDNDFTHHALPLLEQNMLRTYPYYPVHVFYEATPPPTASSRPTPRWSLTDVLRHSDVYTILHSWQPTDTIATRRARQRVHIPPPPPVMVDSADKLPVMRAQQADSRSWFENVASRVPSAPYVTFENIAPLFSTLPCGVTEEDVAVWVEDKRVRGGHRRGYRQMCRFWARLVWRLPSLRVWTDSAEGRREMAAYADSEGPPVKHAAALPPWRYRYAYYLRLDTDSFLHAPVACDPFSVMMAQGCAYGYNNLVVDSSVVTMHLGDAMAEWIDNRTSIKDGERAWAGVNATRSTVAMGGWGRLSDPSVWSIVTLAPARARKQPPLPPTWPWPNVYPEHSSAALSAAEKDVLRALFFTPPTKKARSAMTRRLARVRRDAVEAPYEPLPPQYATHATYNLAMYFNNFEMGTFALKNHPLYTSVAEFFDNRDYDDVTGPEREAAGHDYTLTQLLPYDAVGVEVEGDASVYAAPVYLLEEQHEGDSVVHRVTAPASASSPARFHCLGRRLSGRVGEDPDMNVSARDIDRDWRSGYFQYRWGDAPVHTIGVEAVMQREGWGVCAFATRFGLYRHGTFENT